jgi:hypothetical protein
MTLAMPAMAVAILPRIRFECNGTPPELHGHSRASLEMYLSNVRAELPISGFQALEFPMTFFVHGRIMSVQ